MSNDSELVEVEYPKFIHDFAVQVYKYHQDPFKAAQIDDLPEEYLDSANVRKLKATIIFLCLLYRRVMHVVEEDK